MKTSERSSCPVENGKRHQNQHSPAHCRSATSQGQTLLCNAQSSLNQSLWHLSWSTRATADMVLGGDVLTVFSLAWNISPSGTLVNTFLVWTQCHTSLLWPSSHQEPELLMLINNWLWNYSSLECHASTPPMDSRHCVQTSTILPLAGDSPSKNK